VGSFVLALASYSYCSRSNDVVAGISLMNVANYTQGSFRLKDGNAVVQYSAVLNVGEQNIIMAPLVPNMALWNISQLVPAWAFSSVPPWSDGTEVATAWADPNLHEGVLSTDPSLQLAVQMLITEFNLRAAPTTFLLMWGYLDANLGFLEDMWIGAIVIVFVLFVLVVAAWAADYYYYFWLTVRTDNEEENIYLLKKNSNFYYNG